eukprot:g21567.t1
MNWLTHAFVTTNHNQALIDGSAWPIGIQDGMRTRLGQEINNDLTSVVAALQSSGTMGASAQRVDGEEACSRGGTLLLVFYEGELWNIG